jgi:HD-GYP domain-containing protein (c-di-GMP phosphodiesterase class II)
LRGIEFLAGPARVVAQHHEKWDGSGYPLGLQGHDIDLCARIFSVADAFDAITSNRVYRRGKSYQEAADELDLWAGRQFDPKVVEAFHRVPPQDWDELHKRSLQPKPEDHDVRRMVQSLESQLELMATP